MTASLVSEVAELLADLSRVQGELLEHLNRKRETLAKGDAAELTAMQPHESDLVERLTDCHERREKILVTAAELGLPANNLGDLTQSFPVDEGSELRGSVEDARSQAWLLSHQSLTNWVIVQRTLIHLSQMVEILATGGLAKPTYSPRDHQEGGNGGTLVDHAA